jgi:hypothetical protein
MKHNKYPAEEPKKDGAAKPPNLSRISPELLAQGAADYVPAPDEVARLAYFTYVNQGSRPGHEVQHWLQAEAELIAERNRTRKHGYHNPT